MLKPIGRKQWAIADGYIPSWGHGPDPEMTSHEAFCILNTSDEEAHIEVMLYYEDREPVGPYKVTVPAQRTRHFRFNDLSDPEVIPKGIGYASVFESDQPVVIQQTRLDSRQAENALISTMAYPGEG